MNYLKKLVSPAAIALLAISSFPSFASSISGGAMTINFDSTALAAAFDHETDPNRPAFYLEEYFDRSAYENLSNAEILSTHFIAGTDEISGLGRELTVNGSVVTGRNKATNFSFDTTDIEGTASGAIGLGGAFRYRIDVPFSINEEGDETGNRTIIGDFTLEYDAARAIKGHSGWTLFNHVSWRADVFDLDNVIVDQTGDALMLSGDLAIGEGFDHLGGSVGAIVGDFSLQTSVVPVPATVWLFASGLAGLFVSGRNNKKVVV